MNGGVTFQLLCMTAAQSGIAAREGWNTREKRLLQHPGCGFHIQHSYQAVFGADCIPDETWGASDPSEGFCMQLTSPASCKKYLKFQWLADSQYLGIFNNHFTTQKWTQETVQSVLLEKKKYHALDLLHIFKSCIISKIKAWESAIKP